jgi:hypothetical protein
MKHKTGLVVITSLSISAVTTSVQAAVLFSDGDFSNWVLDPIIAGQIGRQEISGGNPGAFWEVTTITNASTFTFHTHPSFVYDPSLGSLESVEFNLDLNNLAIFGQGHGVGFALKQGGAYFGVGHQITAGLFGWTPLVASGLAFSEGDFFPLGGTSGTLDFSGDPIAVGFFTGNQGGNTARVGYDNFNAILTTTPATTVPEPSTILSTVCALSCGALLKSKR